MANLSATVSRVNNTVPKQSLVCAICSNHYSNPLMMPCLHSFCKKCLEKQIEERGKHVQGGGSIECPTCHVISSLPGGVSSLPSNLWLAHKVEVSSYQHKMKEGKSIPCDRCVQKESGSAVVFCCNCCLFLCKLCHDDHKRWKQTHSHELIDFGEKKSNESIKIPRKPVMCTKHTSKKMKFFCEDCQCLVCRDCIVTKHTGHKPVDLEEVNQKKKQSLNSATWEVNSALASLEWAITSGEKMKQQVNQRKRVVNENITNAFKELYSILSQREKQLHDRNNEIAVAKLAALDQQLKEFNVLKEKVAFVTQVASGTVDYTATELLSTKKLIQQQLEDKLTTLRQLDMEPAENDNISWSVHTDPVVEQISKVGKVSGSVDPAHCTVEEGLANPLSIIVRTKREIKVALKNSDGQIVDEKVVVGCNLKNKTDENVLQFKGTVRNGYASLTVVPQAVGEHELSIKVKNRAISGSPFKVSVHTGKSYWNLSQEQLLEVDGYCNGVTVYKNDVYIASTSKSYLQVFNCNAHGLGLYGSEEYRSEECRSGEYVRNLGSFNSPWGLTIIGDILYVAENGSHCVNMTKLMEEDYGDNHFEEPFYNPTKSLGQFGNEWNNGEQLNAPRGISGDGKGHILVADYGNQRVQVFNTDGTFSHSIFCTSEPYDVAVDNTGNVHVTLYSENRVQVYSSDGQTLHTYNGLNKPRGIAISEDGYICVCSFGSNQLVIFNQQGGMEAQYSVSQPSGVAIDAQGCVYVASCNPRPNYSGGGYRRHNQYGSSMYHGTQYDSVDKYNIIVFK